MVPSNLKEVQLSAVGAVVSAARKLGIADPARWEVGKLGGACWSGTAGVNKPDK